MDRMLNSITLADLAENIEQFLASQDKISQLSMPHPNIHIATVIEKAFQF